MHYRVNIVSPKGEIVKSGLVMDFPALEKNTKALDMANDMLLAMNGNQIEIVGSADLPPPPKEINLVY